MSPDLTITCLPEDHDPLLISVHEVPDDHQVRTEAYLQIQNRSYAYKVPYLHKYSLRVLLVCTQVTNYVIDISGEINFSASQNYFYRSLKIYFFRNAFVN